MRARAGAGSFRSQETLEELCAEAEEQVLKPGEAPEINVWRQLQS